jgi:hypothetical protein
MLGGVAVVVTVPVKRGGIVITEADLPDLLSPPAVFARAFQRLADLITGKR